MKCTGFIKTTYTPTDARVSDVLSLGKHKRQGAHFFPVKRCLLYDQVLRSQSCIFFFGGGGVVEYSNKILCLMFFAGEC